MIHFFSGLVNFLFFLAWHKVSKLFPLRCLPSSWCVWKNAHDWRCAVACDAEWMERWKVNLESSLWRIGAEWYHKSGLSGYCWRCCRIWFHELQQLKLVDISWIFQSAWSVHCWDESGGPFFRTCEWKWRSLLWSDWRLIPKQEELPTSMNVRLVWHSCIPWKSMKE